MNKVQLRIFITAFRPSRVISKFIYPKYYKYWLYTLAAKADCSWLGTIHKWLAICQYFWNTLPPCHQFFSTICWQFWPIFDPGIIIANVIYGQPLILFWPKKDTLNFIILSIAWWPNLPNSIKSTGLIWVFIVLGIYV